jgi:hypothetical protein
LLFIDQEQHWRLGVDALPASAVSEIEATARASAHALATVKIPDRADRDREDEARADNLERCDLAKAKFCWSCVPAWNPRC